MQEESYSPSGYGGGGDGGYGGYDNNGYPQDGGDNGGGAYQDYGNPGDGGGGYDNQYAGNQGGGNEADVQYPQSDNAKDEIIMKLRSQNVKLRQKLKELNQALDAALEKAQKNLTTKKAQQQAPPDFDNILKIKDKEISNQTQMIANLKKDNATLRNRMDTEVGLDKLMKYENALKEAEKRNNELIREIKALQRIQNEQGKQLEKMTTENDYVNKIKTLMDELRIAREKVKELEAKQKKDEKTLKGQFDHMNKLQEKCRELQAAQGGGEGSKKALPVEKEKDIQIHELSEKLLAAEKNKEILQKANESEVKSGSPAKPKETSKSVLEPSKKVDDAPHDTPAALTKKPTQGKVAPPQSGKPKSKGGVVTKEEEQEYVNLIDDKDFEKRYGKLNNSREGSVNKSGGAVKQQPLAPGGGGAGKGIPDKKAAPSEKGKPLQQYEKGLKSSEIRNINQTSSIHESIHDSYSGF
ncbi:hypothetical protein FGO68_gene10437 [Halteria grandinella]|uniref:Lebercilin domain-containing protein n=1 Tax=Halteria grandinella TaxID=5974 RepID=A0A8J8T8H9_HALGN|nr:hypothetical protein FGO68_gene10437 [Halteria grandinella]